MIFKKKKEKATAGKRTDGYERHTALSSWNRTTSCALETVRAVIDLIEAGIGPAEEGKRHAKECVSLLEELRTIYKSILDDYQNDDAPGNDPSADGRIQRGNEIAGTVKELTGIMESYADTHLTSAVMERNDAGADPLSALTAGWKGTMNDAADMMTKVRDMVGAGHGPAEEGAELVKKCTDLTGEMVKVLEKMQKGHTADNIRKGLGTAASIGEVTELMKRYVEAHTPRPVAQGRPVRSIET